MLLRAKWCFILFLGAILGGQSPAAAQTNFATLTTDGGWCWFSDPRAIFHNGSLYFGCVRSDGRSVLNAFNPQTGKQTLLWESTRVEVDDHDVCALQVRADGKLLALYARHITDPFFCYRISTSTNPVSPADWGAEQQIASTGAGLTYCNPARLTSEGNRIYSFSRNLNFNPTWFNSTDGGASWSAPQILIQSGSGSVRPYVKYSSDEASRIDILYTDGHPRNVANSLYHMFYQDGDIYNSSGVLVKALANLPLNHDSGERGSVVYQYSDAPQADANQWIPAGRAWCWEIARDPNGYPVCVFQVQLGTDATWSTSRIFYYYARWTGSAWQKRFIAHAGRALYGAESDYAGGIAIDPLNPNVVYMSSNAEHPFNLGDTTNVPLGARYEIYKGITTDGGLTFAWSAITTNSAVDNCRPYVPRRFGGEPCVLWWRGTYNTYTSFNTSIVGLFTTAVPQPTNAVSAPLPPALPPTPIKKANNTINLDQTNSWIGGRVPNSGEIARWDDTVTAANAVVVGANVLWAGLLITNVGGAVQVTGGNTLTLGAAGIDLRGAAANLTISSSLALGAAHQIWNVGPGRTLTLSSGTFSRTPGATLSLQGAGSIATTMTGLANDSSNNGGFLGPWATIGTGTATAYASLVGGNFASYNGGVAVAYNTIPTSATAATNYVMTVAGSVAYGAATRTMNSLRHAAGPTTLVWGNSGSQINLVVNGLLNAGSGLLTLAQGGSSSLSGVMVGGNNNRELVINAASAPITLSARIINNSGGSSAVVVASDSTNLVTLSGANVHTGGTMLNAGLLKVENNNALGASTGNLAVNGGMLDLGSSFCTVATANLKGGVMQNGTLAAATFTANVPNYAGISTVLAGRAATLTKSGPGVLTLAAPNLFGGATVVNDGTLNLLGSLPGSVSITGGTLTGTGIIFGAVTNQSGGLFAPGADAGSIGALTISNALTLLSGSRVFVKLGRNEAGVLNDRIVGLTELTCGGEIILTNISAAMLVAGDRFQIFSATNYGGAFANVILPPLSGSLMWTNRLAVDGSVAVVAPVSSGPVNLSASVLGTNFAVFWPVDYTGWRLQFQTNGLGANWQDVPGAALTNWMSFPMNHVAPFSAFYRLVHP